MRGPLFSVVLDWVDAANTANTIVFIAVYRALHLDDERFAANTKHASFHAAPTAALLLLGTIAGCGGGVLSDLLNVHQREIDETRARQARSVSHAFLAAAIATALLDPSLPFPKPANPRHVLWLVALTNVVLPKLGFAQRLGRALLWLVNIPPTFVPSDLDHHHHRD
jgi:hypothetical protein